MIRNFHLDRSFSDRIYFALWKLISFFFFGSFLFPSFVLTLILRLFGAKIGSSVVYRENFFVKDPRKLSIGDFCWFGRGVSIFNDCDCIFGSEVCVSQGSTLITGNHDLYDGMFTFFCSPIVVGSFAWIGANCLILPGVHVNNNCFITAGTVLKKTTVPSFSVVSSKHFVSISPREDLLL